MEAKSQLTQREWWVISIFLALVLSFVCIAYLSDKKVDGQVQTYIREIQSKKNQ